MIHTWWYKQWSWIIEEYRRRFEHYPSYPLFLIQTSDKLSVYLLEFQFSLSIPMSLLSVKYGTMNATVKSLVKSKKCVALYEKSPSLLDVVASIYGYGSKETVLTDPSNSWLDLCFCALVEKKKGKYIGNVGSYQKLLKGRTPRFLDSSVGL